MTEGPDTTTPSSSLPIAIAGGGIIGLSLAWRLAESGWAVEVFDQGKAGGEASWAGAGMLAPGGEVEEDSPLASLVIQSRSLYRGFVEQLQQESGVTIDMQEAGALELAYSEEEASRLEARAKVQEGLGIQSRALSPAQITTFWPRVRRDGLQRGRFYPNDAIVDPRDVIGALRKVLAGRGVKIHEQHGVERVSIASEFAEIVAGSATKMYAAVVVAMGAWSSGLIVSGVPPLPISEPVKGHLIAYHQPEQTCGTIIRRGSTYLLQRANGLLIVGASVERLGFDRTVRPEIVADLERQASLVLPHLEETTPSASWIGFRPHAESLHVGPWHSPRLQLAYGHYRNGILLAPLTAQAIAGEINSSL